MLHRHASAAVAASYTTGAVLGAMTTAFVLMVGGGLLSPLPRPVRLVVGVAALLSLVARQLGLLRLELPQRRYQIPRETFGHPPQWAAFRFAYELGLGVRTYVTSSAPYAIVVVVVLLPRQGLVPTMVETAAVAVGFGLGRSVVVASQAWRGSIAIEPPRWALKATATLAIASLLFSAAVGHWG